MGKKPDERALRAWQTLLRAHHALVQRMSAELENEHDLSLAWYEVLLRLSRAPGERMRMTELAGSTYFSPSGMTRLVDRMCDDGLVERHVCETDRRGVNVILTPAGKDRLRAASATHLRGIQQHFAAPLTADEADAIADSLSRVADRLADR
jgi:DNA-binding MarR family transcriptional regulator